MKTDELDVPVPPEPLTKKFPEIDAARDAYTPGILAEDRLENDNWELIISLTGSEEYPMLTVGTFDPATDDDIDCGDVLWTAVWWAHAVGIVPRTNVVIYANKERTESFRLGGLYRYAGLDYHPDETSDDGRS